MAARPSGNAPRSALAPILVVDDDGAVRAFCRAVLERAGYRVIEAGDGEEALEVLTATTVSLIVLDNRMPRMGGLEVLEQVRARPWTETLPVIMFSADSEVDDRVYGLSAGATDYLGKPVHPDELVARVQTHLRGQQAWLRTVEQQLQERTTVGDALLRLQPSSSPEGTAGAITRELLALGHVSGAAMLAFTPDGVARLIASSGTSTRDVTSGGALPVQFCQLLRRRAADGPWTELREAQPAGALGVPLGASETPASAFAPLRTSGPPLGLLVIAADPDAGGDVISQALATAIDFSHVASVLLGPLLEARGELEALREQLARVLRERAFTPHYQPIVDLSDGVVAGHEVLTRFRDGTSPEIAFRQAASLDMSIDLETATMAPAVHDARNLPEGTWLSVNVSPTFVTSGGELPDLVRGSDRPIVLELTEHDPIADYPRLLSAVRRLNSGVRLSVDDAGAGYASLHHILKLKPEYVKLDRGWITGLDADPARQALVAGLAFFAERTGSLLIAEGVETEAELAALRRLGVHFGQGWLLGRPTPIQAR